MFTFSAYNAGGTDGITELRCSGDSTSTTLYMSHDETVALLLSIQRCYDAYEKHLSFEDECGRIRYYMKYDPKRHLGEDGMGGHTAEEHMTLLLMEIDSLEKRLAATEPRDQADSGLLDGDQPTD